MGGICRACSATPRSSSWGLRCAARRRRPRAARSSLGSGLVMRSAQWCGRTWSGVLQPSTAMVARRRGAGAWACASHPTGRRSAQVAWRSADTWSACSWERRGSPDERGWRKTIYGTVVRLSPSDPAAWVHAVRGSRISPRWPPRCRVRGARGRVAGHRAGCPSRVRGSARPLDRSCSCSGHLRR